MSDRNGWTPLQPGTPITGRFERDENLADLDAVMRQINDARLEDTARLLRMQESR